MKNKKYHLDYNEIVTSDHFVKVHMNINDIKISVLFIHNELF